MSSPAIVVDRVSKQYRLTAGKPSSIKDAFLSRHRGGTDEFDALQDVSLTIPRGSFYSLIGHNGSGKSTLLKILAGIHRATSGSVTVNGRVSALLELGSGFHPELTGRENIHLNGAILGLSRKEIARSVDSIVDFSGIGDFIDSPVKVYSSGMYVRLGFAVAVHVNPEILIVDEVIAVGDEDFQRRCLEHLHTLRMRGVTVVLVSHSISLVESMSDEVGWLDHGRLMQVGPAPQVCEAYLSQVNQQEFDRAEAAAAAADATDPDGEADEIEVDVEGRRRRGSGQVRLEGLEFFDQHGQPHPIASSGDPLRIRMWCSSEKELPSASFQVTIRHSNGSVLAAPLARVTTIPSTEEGSPFHVDLIIDRVPFLPGHYSLDFSIEDGDRSTTYDAWQHAEVLRVQPGSSTEREGVVDIAARWDRGDG
ncbi:MAG: ABC transporter ATP-binding protein [Acidimicrobiales bacterium]